MLFRSIVAPVFLRTDIIFMQVCDFGTIDSMTGGLMLVSVTLVRERALSAGGTCSAPTEVKRRSNPFESELDSKKIRSRTFVLLLIFIYVRERIRTPDTLVRSQVLYPAELRTHIYLTL